MRRLILAAGMAVVLKAQNPGALRESFEGRQVMVKMDMPATKDGVDLYLQRPNPLDLGTYQDRLKRNGIGVNQGDRILVTKLVVKESIIEFHLGGGGYGTFGDEGFTRTTPLLVSKSRREEELEKDLRDASGSRRRDIERQLDSMRRDRERANARNRATAEQTDQIAKARIEQKRLSGGSRFNIRFDPKNPGNIFTPEGLTDALSRWVDFSQGQAPAAAATPLRTLPLLVKGMTRAAVDAALGTPIDITDRMEGTIAVTTAVYDVAGVTAKIDFAGGVLIKFIYQSR
ncbi:MAG: hypothetical protein HYZ37_01235 [Candidatus Solibacter usitatus]|nr:hypothetical protein [Candidatus Solibacter usitatus]